jgi:hypothetical protein
MSTDHQPNFSRLPSFLRIISRQLRSADTPQAPEPLSAGLKAGSKPLHTPPPRPQPQSLARHYFTRLQDQHPNFREYLGKQPTIAGWSHNPWQEADTADAKATEIATRYLHYFTSAMVDMGYMPYFGTEINFCTITNSDDGAKEVFRAINNIYEDVAASYQQKRMHHFALEGGQEPQLHPKLSRNDEWNGRVYVDPTDEMEIATPCQSPLANAARVNGVKRVVYESTLEYAKRFAQSPEGRHQPDLAVPSGPAADLLASAMPPYNILYADKDEPTGEHCSVSLIATRPGRLRDYAHRKADRKHFADSNLFREESWASICREAFERYLPHDELMAYGHPEKFSNLHKPMNNSVKGKSHNIRWHYGGTCTALPSGTIRNVTSTDKSEASNRLEVRSFNDGSSNIALSSLAMLSTLYAVTKEYYALHPDRHYARPMSGDDMKTIREKLSARTAPQHQVPGNIQEARQRFSASSLCLRMMQEYAIEHTPDDLTRQQMLTEIEEFRKAVLQRAIPILQTSHHR